MEVGFDYTNDEECVKALSSNSLVIKYIPHEYQTEEMILIAVSHDPEMLKYAAFQNEKICKACSE